MKKYFKFLGIAFMATAFCMGFASCGDKDDNSTSGAGGITPSGYVDLGLPSGTKWKAENETNSNEDNYYTYEEAIAAFGKKLPTKEQFMELRNECDWTWAGMGYKIVGSNGKSITLPAAGVRDPGGSIDLVGSTGFYWSSSPNGSIGWYFQFGSGDMDMGDYAHCIGLTVRLVQN